MILLSGLLDDDELADDGDDLLGGTDDALLGDDLFTDDGEDAGSTEDELTYRLDEVEKEIDNLGNKVDSVRGENEQISDSITNVERNVDKLVELYEIVTQGINPFVDDQAIGNAFETAAQQGSVFGSGEDPEDEIDEDILGAEADDFLDEEIDDDELDEEFDQELADEAMLEEEMDDPDEAFADDFDAELADDEDDEFDELLPEETESGDDEFDELLEEEASSFEQELATADVGEQAADGQNGEMGEPPYLVTRPTREDAEIMLLEWLDFLLEETDVVGAAQTIAYYESVGWISASVASYLHTMLDGFTDGVTVADDELEARSVLDSEAHKQSLQYIAWIAAPHSAPELLSDAVDEPARAVSLE